MEMKALEEQSWPCPQPRLLLLLLASLLLRPTHTLGVTRREAAGAEGLLELSQAVTHLTQRFAILEVNIESRLSHLSETATKGEQLIESLSSRLSKVDSLVEKVDALDSRLTLETSSLRSTINKTNRDMQITRSISEYVERTLPHLLERSLITLHNALYNKISKSVGELQHEVREAREDLEDLGTQTMTAAAEAREDIQKGSKETHDAVEDINTRIETVHQDLSAKITSTPPLGSLQPVLQQVNHTVVQSIARATAGLNVTLYGEAARRRGATGTGAGHFGRPPNQVQDCTDPTTVEALIEVKYLLKSLLKKSEDLRRGLTQQARDGVELLKLLNLRFLFLLRFVNTESDHGTYLHTPAKSRSSTSTPPPPTLVSTGQILVSEMQDLGNLVESSYTAILVAQNAFIDSCKRIQIEEPTLELKITEILDKLVTNIDLGQEFNRQQLRELREVVERLGGDAATSTPATGAPTLTPQDVAESEVRGDQQLPAETSVRLTVLRDILLKAIQATNVTVIRLESVEDRVDGVSAELLQTDWTDLRQKEPADQLVTAAKDLKGYAQEQIFQSLNLHEFLSVTLDQISINSSLPGRHDTATATILPLELSDANAALRLPPSCTAALLQQVRNLPQLRPPPATTARAIVEEEEDSEENIPAWYTNPDFLSGNYGTPDRGFPVFREEEWVDMAEDYARDDYHAEETTSSEPPKTTAKPVTPGGVDRYFGVNRTPNNNPAVARRRAGRAGDFP